MSLITSALKNLHKQLIDEVVEGCAVPCTFVFGGCERVCACSETPQLASPNNFCSVCNGTGKILVEETECIQLPVTFNAKEFKSMAGRSLQVNEGYAETMCSIELVPKIRSAQYVILDSCNDCYMNNRYKRFSSPEPCGLADKHYVLTVWELING